MRGRGSLFLAPPVENAVDASASVERFLLLRVQAVIKRLKLGLDCLQAGKPGPRHLFSANSIRPGVVEKSGLSAHRCLRRGGQVFQRRFLGIGEIKPLRQAISVGSGRCLAAANRPNHTRLKPRGARAGVVAKARMTRRIGIAERTTDLPLLRGAGHRSYSRQAEFSAKIAYAQQSSCPNL